MDATQWRTKGKGAVVRAGAALTSEVVCTLGGGVACVGVETRVVDGKRRVRLAEPAGWVSGKCLLGVAPLGAARVHDRPYTKRRCGMDFASLQRSLDDADDEAAARMVDGRGRGYASFDACGATASTEVLWLDNNALTSTSGLGRCRALRTLVLTNNKLARVEGLEALAELQELVLNGNAIEALPELASSAALGDVVLNDNRLSALPSALPLGSLRTLWAERNALTAVPEALGRCTLLQTLGLSGNELTALPPLQSLSRLRCLELRHNRLASLPADVGALGALETLYVDHNVLASLPASLARLSRLTALDAARNRLTACDGVDALARLEHLSLDGNRLARAPACGELRRLKTLWLHGNPGLHLAACPGPRGICYADGASASRDDRVVLGRGEPTVPHRNFAPAPRSRRAHAVVAFAVQHLGEWRGVLHRGRPDVDAAFVFDSKRTGYGDGADRFQAWLAGLAATYETLSLLGSSQGAFGALRFSHLATGSVLAFSPMPFHCNVDAVDFDVFTPLPEDTKADVHIYVGKLHARDVRAANEFQRRLGPKAQITMLKSSGHGADMLITDRNTLDAFVADALPGAAAAATEAPAAPIQTPPPPGR